MLASLFDDAPYGVAVLDEDVHWVYLNPAMAHINGRPVHEHLGRHPVDLAGRWAKPWVASIERVLETGRALPAERLAIPYPDRRVVFELVYSPVSGVPELRGRKGVMVQVRDVTAAYAEQSLLSLLATGATLLGAADEMADVAHGLAAIGAEVISGRAAFALAEGERLRLLAVAGPGTPALEGRLDESVTLPPDVMAVEAVRTGLVQRADGVDEVLRRNAGGDGLLWPGELGVAVSVPIVVTDEVVAVLELGRLDPRPLAAAELDAIRTLADMGASAVARVRRTAARSERRLRDAFDALLEDVTITQAVRDEHGAIADFRIVFANRRSVDGAGRALTEQLGARVLDLYPGFRESGLFDAYVRVVETGEPFVADEQRYEDVIDGVPVQGWWNLLVSKLGDGYLACSRDVTSVVEARRQVAEAEEARRSEREAVRLLQQFALPLRLPSVPGVDVAAAHLPASGDSPLGGDWYDAAALAGDRLCLVIGDVTGHGREAAQAMIDMRRLIGRLGTDVAEPTDVLAEANRHLLGTPGYPMATCCYLVIDPGARTLTYALAGHLPPVIRDRSGTVVADGPPGPPLGVTVDARYVAHTVHVDGDVAVVTFTDGLVERRGEHLDDAIEALRDCVAGWDGGTADGLRDRIVAAFGSNPDDDACVLVATCR